MEKAFPAMGSVDIILTLGKRVVDRTKVLVTIFARMGCGPLPSNFYITSIASGKPHNRSLTPRSGVRFKPATLGLSEANVLTTAPPNARYNLVLL